MAISDHETRNITEIVFREDLYPRIETSAATVQTYSEDLDILPPVEVNQHNELIDGWHRWTAHKKMGISEIPVVVTETKHEAHFLELAIKRNAVFGLRLSNQDKQDMARKIYNATPERDRNAKKVELQSILSVSDRQIRNYLSRIDKDTKAARDRRIFDLWMACHTQQEIGEAVGCHKDTVSEICRKMAELPESDKHLEAAE
jgi:hypothetical protein